MSKSVKKKSERQISLGDIFLGAYETVRKNLPESAGILFIPYIILFTARTFQMVDESAGAESSGAVILMNSLCGLIYGYATLVILKVFDMKKSSPGRIGKAARYSLGRFLNVSGVWLLCVIVFILIMLPASLSVVSSQRQPVTLMYYGLSFLPVIYLWLRYGQAWLIALFEPKIKNSFNESDRICRGRKTSVFTVNFIVVLISIIVMAVMNMFGAVFSKMLPRDVFLPVYIGVMLVIWGSLAPYFTAVYYLMYVSLSATAKTRQGKGQAFT